MVGYDVSGDMIDLAKTKYGGEGITFIKKNLETEFTER